MTNLPQRRTVSSTWIAGGVLAFVALGAAGCDSGDKGDKAAPAPAASSAPAAGATSAAEGTFAFTVTGSKCGVTSVGPADLEQKATGQFCLVNVSVKNVGTEATLLDSAAQKGIDAEGKEYPIADLATVFVNEKSPALLEEIKPGAEVAGVLPFQVPAATKLAAVVLHGSNSTPGVRVTLS